MKQKKILKILEIFLQALMLLFNLKRYLCLFQSCKNQRSQKLKRAWEKLSFDQTLITDLAEKITKFLNDNVKMIKKIFTYNKIKKSEINSENTIVNGTDYVGIWKEWLCCTWKSIN